MRVTSSMSSNDAPTSNEAEGGDRADRARGRAALSKCLSHLLGRTITIALPGSQPGRAGRFGRVVLALMAALVVLMVPQRAHAVIDGKAVTDQEQRQRGLVVLSIPGSSCSGVLIANDWLLTAGHCADSVRTQPSALTATLVGASVRADAVYLFGGYSDEVGPDLALVHLERPFVIGGASTGFVNRLWPGDARSLMQPQRVVADYGQGFSAYVPVPPNAPPGSPACPGTGLGTYRAADLKITAIDKEANGRPTDPLVRGVPTTFRTQAGGHYFSVEKNNDGQIFAPGDSGGPAFIWQDGKPYIVGINSGSPCNGNSGHLVSIPTVRDWIAAVLKTQWSASSTSQPVWVLPAEVKGTKWGLTDVNQVGWAQAARAAAAMCFNRGFAGGHFDGHQGSLNGNQGFGIQCSRGNTLWRNVTAGDLASTGWGFSDVNAVHWAHANRAAERLCASYNQGFAGGHLNGHMRDGQFGLFCYKDGAQFFDATDPEIAATGFPVSDLNKASWAQAARAATGVCRAKGFSGGFFNGQQVPGKHGVVCQK